MERVPTFALIFSFVCFSAFGQVFASPVTEALDSDAVRYLLASLGGDQGVRSIGMSASIVQLLIRVLQSSISDRFFSKRGPWARLAMVSALTFAITPIGLMSSAGLSLTAALVHTTTLNAFMVFLDQLIKHWPSRKGKKDAPGSRSVRDSSFEDHSDRG